MGGGQIGEGRIEGSKRRRGEKRKVEQGNTKRITKKRKKERKEEDEEEGEEGEEEVEEEAEDEEEEK